MAASSARSAASRTTTDPLRRVVIGAHPVRTLVRVFILVIASLVIFGYVLIPVRGEGPSMLPTMADGDLGFINTLAYWRREPARGDIIALRLAGRRVVYIKRVVGLPGEHVQIDSGIVQINGQPLVEPYVTARSPWPAREATLGADEYLLMGDNRALRQGQADFGKARRDRIIGKVLRW
jgi:signal peptidase I